MRADRAAVQITDIANAAAFDKSLIPGVVNSLNQCPHATRAAIIALATALGTAVNLPESSQGAPDDLGKVSG
jgi:hypothetical protein